MVTLAPSQTLAAEREAAQEKLLAEKKASLSEQEIKEIIAACKALKERQQAEDSPEALASIPVLDVADIRKEAY